MYSEESDFERHDREVERFLELLRSCHLSIPSDALVLDVGGDLGMHAWKLLPLCRQLYVTDVVNYSAIYEGHLLHLVEEKHRRNGRPFDLAKIAFVTSDAERQIFREDLFDVVFSINSFEHIPDPNRAWSEIIRVSKESAVVYVELDPLWTSPGGGHFQDYVQEPWAHLLWPVAEYQGRMRSAGASDKEIDDFPSAMNRGTLDSFRQLFETAQKDGYVRIVATQTWPLGPEEEPHSAHQNFARLRAMGYAEEDLIVRGLRVLAIRTAKRWR